MKCPLLAIAWGGVVAKQQEEYPDCLKEACAWWDDGVEQCGFLSVSLALRGMLALLSLIAEKIPHEEQFRR